MIVLLKKLQLLHAIVEEIWQADDLGKWYRTQSKHWNQDKRYFGTSTLNEFPDDSTGRKLNRLMTVKKGDCHRDDSTVYTDNSTEGWQ